MPLPPVTVIITSSNRFDLLERTLDSFLALNTYPIHRYILNEDSGNQECLKKIQQRYGHIIEIHFQPQRRGLSAAWDHLLSHVTTDYVFNLEDDWLFSGNRHFMHHAVSILEKNSTIHQVWVRDPLDHSHPLYAHPDYKSCNYYIVEKNYRTEKWGGFTFNPSLRRLTDLRRFFPRGLHRFGDEAICSRHVEAVGYSAVSLTDPACRHIGWDRHSEGFQP